MGSISAERMPSAACTRCSCGGSTTAFQSGTCSICLPRIACDGKLACASSGVRSAEGPVNGWPCRATDITLNPLPSRACRKAADTLKSRNAVPTIAWNTGWMSFGDSLITRRIPAVAVCCSSASCVSLNSRAFWIAITAWSAKVCSSASSLSVNAPRDRATPTTPMPRSSHTIGAKATEW